MTPEPKESRPSPFAWEPDRPFPLIFAGLVLLSLFAHFAAFFLFQVTYPQRVTIPPLAPQVTVLSPDLPEHQALLAWIAAEDPALSMAAARASVPGIQQVPYQPSYAVVRTWPHSAPREVRPVPFPAGRSGLEMLASADNAPAPAVNSLPPAKTTLVISESLAMRALQGVFEVSRKAAAALQPTQLLVGVADSGQVRFHFLHRSSGDQEMDDSALQAILKCSFETSPAPITWGFVTVIWGDEAYATPAKNQSTR